MSVLEWGVIGLGTIVSTYLLGLGIYEIWHARRQKRANYLRNCRRAVEHARRR